MTVNSPSALSSSIFETPRGVTWCHVCHMNGVIVWSGLAEEASPPADLREQQQSSDPAERRQVLRQLVHPLQRRSGPRTGQPQHTHTHTHTHTLQLFHFNEAVHVLDSVTWCVSSVCMCLPPCCQGVAPCKNLVSMQPEANVSEATRTLPRPTPPLLLYVRECVCVCVCVKG